MSTPTSPDPHTASNTNPKHADKRPYNYGPGAEDGSHGSATGGTGKPDATKPATAELEFLKNTEVAQSRGWTAFRQIQPAPEAECRSDTAAESAEAGGSARARGSDKGRGKEKAAVEDASGHGESEHGFEPEPEEAAAAHAGEQATHDSPAQALPAESASAHREAYTRSKEVMLLFLHKKHRQWGRVADLYNGYWYPGQGTVVSPGALRTRHYHVTKRGGGEFADEHYDWMHHWDGPEPAQPEE